ncbi:hypothetical protein GVN21_16820 [Caulobacter sp. SLTY]|uniref:hypothetical protein n=1 Tax=Caulobacter sp. SLTY TaxID=2683262 RepID=UPI001412E39E|nr:hypothetical protein [Caulobacter sp. SLTY]NBB17031.1 hypothetical protein [Caulobacter sp. SLTY]
MREFLPYAAFLVSVIACGLSLYVVIRAGRWRDSDDAKALDLRLTTIASTANAAAPGAALTAVATRVTTLEKGMESVATKADIAKLTAEVRGVEKTIENVDKGVTRIEDHLMEMARDGVRT